jgi:hypothetical protein
MLSEFLPVFRSRSGLAHPFTDIPTVTLSKRGFTLSAAMVFTWTRNGNFRIVSLGTENPLPVIWERVIGMKLAGTQEPE